MREENTNKIQERRETRENITKKREKTTREKKECTS